MTNFYTNVLSVGNNILYRGVKDGRRIKLKIPYKPSLYLPTQKETEFKTLNEEFLEKKTFPSIREARDFIKKYEDVNNFKIYGMNRFEYAFIAEVHKGVVEHDQDSISIAVIDIEVGSENGFPDPYQANEPITSIAIRYMNGDTLVYGCGDYQIQGDEKYFKCKDEWSLCKKFIEDWQENCPDVISGWNIKFFDIPYLFNRFNRVLGEDYTKKLSPWGLINQRKVFSMNKENIAYEILGVATWDYIELYRWYAPGGKSQESYKLDSIANVEIGENKLSYDEYDNLHQLYRLNYQKFIEYNIKDVDLIFRLEDKLKLIELGLTLAYDTKSNYEDIFAQTRMWDAIIYNDLLGKNYIVPPKSVGEKDDRFEGAYVKEPQIGMHEWVASFDLDSLYPHLMMQYNLSPEMLVDPRDYTDDMREVISSGVSVEKLLNKQVDTSKLDRVTLTPNGQFFRTDKQGFLPRMLEEMYVDRKKFKNKMLQVKQEYENESDSQKKRELDKLISKYNNLQLAKKVALNSAYGAMGSKYFRFYDLRQALAVTTSGQLSIRWIENKINQFMNKLLKSNSDYVIASDTDSIYLRMSELVDKVYGNKVKSMDKQKIIEFMDKVCEEKLQPFIDESYQELAEYVHAFKQKMRMKREGLSDKGIWTAKKRYILNVYNNEGVQYKEPYLKVMGLEMIKSSTPSAIRQKMEETIKILVRGTELEAQQFIEEFQKQFKNLPPEEISFPRGLNGLKEYSDSVMMYKKGTPIHVKGAIIYNHYLKQMKLEKKYPLIQEGEKLKFTYLKQPNIFKDTVISYPGRLPPEFGLHEYVDYDMQFQKAYLDPVKIILDCMGWKHEKVNSLDNFFG
jgi:DNA polymerase elongation subunit (family B)